MTLAPWDAKFEDVLRACLPMLEPMSRLEAQTRLADLGLDEAALAELTARLGETYCVALRRDDLGPVESATPGTVWEVVQALVQALWDEDLIALEVA